VIYLDASALVKLIRPEAESSGLRSYLSDRRDTPKVTSAISFAELARAVRSAYQDPVKQRDMMEAELDLAGELLSTMRIVEINRDVIGEAAKADGSFLRTLQAIHLVSATRIAFALSALVTYDERLSLAAREAGLPVVAPT
jgi:uncharacterized protein